MSEILSLCEAAAFLRISRGSLKKQVEEQNIPHFYLAGDIRFEQNALNDWIKKQMNPERNKNENSLEEKNDKEEWFPEEEQLEEETICIDTQKRYFPQVTYTISEDDKEKLEGLCVLATIKRHKLTNNSMIIRELIRWADKHVEDFLNHLTILDKS